MRVVRDWMGFTEIEDNSKKVKVANHIFEQMFDLIKTVNSSKGITECKIENDNLSLKVEREEFGIVVIIRQNKNIMTGESIYRKTHKYDIIFIDNEDMHKFYTQANNNIPKE